MKEKASELKREMQLLYQSVPGYIIALFVVSVVCMNLLANKSVNDLPEWFALDCGIFLSWMSFLCMDTVTKHFGPRACIHLTIFALIVNLLISVIFFLISIVPGTWSAFYEFDPIPQINEALDITFMGTWFILLGSSIAFFLSSLVNAFTNHTIGKKLKKDNFASFSIRAYISTAIAQFVDNLTFALIVSHTFFGWSLIQCVTCALTGMLVELLCEVVFSPLGYKVSKSWKRNNVGEKYISQYYSK